MKRKPQTFGIMSYVGIWHDVNYFCLAKAFAAANWSIQVVGVICMCQALALQTACTEDCNCTISYRST